MVDASNKQSPGVEAVEKSTNLHQLQVAYTKAEERILRVSLAANQWNVARTAAEQGIPKSSLMSILRKGAHPELTKQWLALKSGQGRPSTHGKSVWIAEQEAKIAAGEDDEE